MGRLGGLLACLLPIVVGIASTPTTIGTNATPPTTGTSYRATTADGTATIDPIKPDGAGDGHSGPSLAPQQTNVGSAHLLEESHHHLAHPGPQITAQGRLRNATAASASPSSAQGRGSSPNDSAEEYPRRKDLPEEEDDWEVEGGLASEKVGESSTPDKKGGLARTRSKREASSQTGHNRQNLPPEEISDLTLEEEIKEWGRWDEREGKRLRNPNRKRRRHRLRHGKRRHERGNRELLDTDFSFGSFGFGSSSIVIDDNQEKKNSHGFYATSPPMSRTYDYQQEEGGRDWPNNQQTTAASHKRNYKTTSSEFRTFDFGVTVPQDSPSVPVYSSVNHFKVSQMPSKRPSDLGSSGMRSDVHHHIDVTGGDSLQDGSMFIMNDESSFQRDDPIELPSDRRSSKHRVREHIETVAHGEERGQRNIDESLNGAKELLKFSSAVLNPNSNDHDLTETRKHKIEKVEDDSRQQRPAITPNAALQNSELFIDREQFKISVSKNYSTQRQNNHATTGPAISTELNYKYEHKKEDEKENKNETDDVENYSRYVDESNPQPGLEGRRAAISIHISSPPVHGSLGTTPSELQPAEDAWGNDKHYILPFPSPPNPNHTPAPPASLSPPPTPSSLPLPAPSISASSPSSPSLPSPLAKDDGQLKYPAIVISNSGRVQRVSGEDLPAEVLLQSMLPSTSMREVSSAPLVLLNHETLRKSQTPPNEMAAAALAAAGSCYSTNDIIVVIFLTSLVNMVAFLVVTLGLCWCSLRGRLNAAPSRTIRADDQRSDDNDEEAEITMAPEGCLEACLPDISYQRHIARGTTLRPTFVMGRALRPLVSPNPPRLSHAVHELLHTLTNSPDYQQHKKKLSMTNRRSLSLENLALT